MNDNEPTPCAVPPSHRRASALTRVELLWIEKKIEHWLRFGRRAEEKLLDRRRSVASFTPDSVFGFVRWASNGYGTVVSRMDIVRAVGPGERFQTLPFVRPGGEILLRAIEIKVVQPREAAVEGSRIGASRRIFGDCKKASA